MTPSCEEYRDEVRLLQLRKRLAEEALTPDERKEIEKLVEELELKLKM